MQKKGISQEWLKAIACATMFLDHIGAYIFGSYELRIIGRLAFPIYCFLLVEGMKYTRNPKRYGIRLLIGAVISEIVYDMLKAGTLNWESQSVMVTLLLGFFMILWMKKAKMYLIPLLVCFFGAELLQSDYGGWGIALIWLFAITQDVPLAKQIQTAGMAAIFLLMGSFSIPVGPLKVPIQLFGVLSMVPIWLYSGKKTTGSKLLQWGFYLFYPLHLFGIYILIQLLS